MGYEGILLSENPLNPSLDIKVKSLRPSLDYRCTKASRLLQELDGARKDAKTCLFFYGRIGWDGMSVA